MGGQNAGGDHRADNLALARRSRRQQPFDLQPLHGYRHRLHMAVRARADDLQQRRWGAQRLTAQDAADRLDLLVGQGREVGQRAFAHAAALAERFS